jgi:Protein of unknown function (DUF3102)
VAQLAQLDNPNLWAPAVSRIKELHEFNVASAQSVREKAIEVGELLLTVRRTLKHGEWLPWIEKYLPFGDEWARVYIRAYECRNDPKFLPSWNLSQHKLGNGATPGQPQQLHEPNFHSQAVRLRQNLVGLFNHYLQRRPLKSWATEEIYDLLSSLKSLTDICAQLENELGTRNDLPASYRQTNGN